MSRPLSRIWIAPLLLLGLAWPQGGPEGPLEGEGAEAVATDEVASTTAQELWAHPGRHLGSEVRVTVQFHSHVETWNPFLTRFGSADYGCVRAWADEQRPWVAREFERPAARFFARRDGAAHWALEDAERYQRFEFRGVVRAVFGAVPWIEITGVKPLLRGIGEGTVLHASRGVELATAGVWERARSEFERALAGSLPEAVQLELESWIERCDEEIALIPYRPWRRDDRE